MCAYCRVDRSEWWIIRQSLTHYVTYVGRELLGQLKKIIVNLDSGFSAQQAAMVSLTTSMQFSSFSRGGRVRQPDFWEWSWNWCQLSGWQKFRKAAKGLRRKVWTQTKILSPNIRYFVAILRFVVIYALTRRLWQKKSVFLGINQCFLGEKCTSCQETLFLTQKGKECVNRNKS